MSSFAGNIVQESRLTDITEVYSIMNTVILAVILALYIYVIGFRLRFKLDRAGYIILLTQLFILFLRLLMETVSSKNHWQTWFQAAITFAGYIANETTLIFFMFEMKYVKLRTESPSLDHYNQAKRPVRIVKYLIIAAQLLVQLPFGVFSQGLSSQDDRA